MSKKIHSEETKEQLRSIIGTRARAARRVLRLTQEQASKRIGVSAEFYARIERCKALPSIDTLAQMSDGLEITVDHLLGFDGVPTSRVIERQQRLTPTMRHIVERAREDKSLTRLLIAILKATEPK